MNIQHDLLRELLDGNYVSPVMDALARRPLQRQIKVLDLCTGTGKWYVTLYISILWAYSRCNLRRVVEMAEEFPHAKFNGLDIGMWCVMRHLLVGCSDVAMQLRLPQGPRHRTSSSRFTTLPPAQGSPTNLSTSFMLGTAVFSLYVTLPRIYHSPPVSHTRPRANFHVTGSRVQCHAL